MATATRLGPWLLGTVKDTTGTTAGLIRNLGATIVAQTYTAPASVMLTSPAVQLMFTLPAGSKILRFNTEVVTAITTATQVAVVIGNGTGSNNQLVTTFNTGVTVGKVAQATIDTALQVALANNVGTTDYLVYGTFTATTGNAAAGAIVVTCEYMVRNPDGSYAPTV